MSKQRYVERALFLLGDQNTGKSTQLRSMFVDRRFGHDGNVPTARNLANSYSLGNHRRLYLRLTSPHEAGENIDAFLEKCDYEMSVSTTNVCRWNFAGALQVTATDSMGPGPEVIGAFNERYSPERVRAVVLSPDRLGNTMPWEDVRKLTQELRKTPHCEVIFADATERHANGLVYTDFFDFT